MNDDIREALRGAAEPGSGRPFRHTIYDAIATGRRYRRRRSLLAAGGSTAVAAVAAGALVLAFGSLRGADQDRGGGEPPVAGAGERPARETKVPMDLGPLSPSETERVLRTCARGFGGADAYTAVFARRMDGLYGPTPVVFAEDPSSDRTIACDSGGGGYIAGVKEVVNLPDAQHPIRAVDGHTGNWDCERKPRTGVRYSMTETASFRVADNVDRVEVRVGTEDRPGVWRVSRPHHGFLYAGYWFHKPFPPDATITLEYRAFDTDGNPIRSADLDRVFDREMPSRVASSDGIPQLCGSR
jgi:hypothetical protein